LVFTEAEIEKFMQQVSFLSIPFLDLSFFY